MFYQNYYPYNINYNYKRNNYNNFVQPVSNSEKKDTESPKSETIPFQDFKQPVQNTANTSQNCTTENTRSINILGISLEIDDLIIIGLIILLFLESDKNYGLIIILGLILLNVNLSDILNIF